MIIWAFRLRRRAFRCKSAVVCRGAHGRGQVLPQVALPLSEPPRPPSLRAFRYNR